MDLIQSLPDGKAYPVSDLSNPPESRADWLCYHCIPKNKRKVTNKRGVSGYCDLCGEEDKLWAVSKEKAEEE